jgi:GTP pyrophosphokinase
MLREEDLVKVREGLPLIDGQTTTEDSASLAAQMIAQQQHGYYKPGASASFDLLNEDLKKQLSTSKLTTAMDRSIQADFLPLNDAELVRRIQLDTLTYSHNGLSTSDSQ